VTAWFFWSFVCYNAIIPGCVEHATAFPIHNSCEINAILNKTIYRESDYLLLLYLSFQDCLIVRNACK